MPASPSLISGLLHMGAAYLETEKQLIIDKAGPVADTGIDAIAKAVKDAVGHSFIAGFIDHAVDNLDATAKAAVPKELGAFIDFIVAQLNALAG